MEKNKRIVFFSSGDFAVNTLISLIESGYNIVGVVTSKDKHTFKDVIVPRIVDVAIEHNIPFIVPEHVNDDETYEWLKEKAADVFCVISYKKLPDRILALAKDIAFNVHASVLPFLRGAAPINYALMNGYEKTGLTAFVLSDEIDCGDILQNTVIDIEPDDNFKTLYWKLSDACVEFTKTVLDNIMYDCEFYIRTAIKQSVPCTDITFDAPKIDSEYTKNWNNYRPEVIMDILRSVYSVDGLYLRCFITDKKTGNMKDMEMKILQAEIVNMKTGIVKDDDVFLTDKKKYLHILIWNGRYNVDTPYLSIKEIQVAGKKRMGIEEFLRGFQCYLDKGKYDILFSDY